MTTPLPPEKVFSSSAQMAAAGFFKQILEDSVSIEKRDPNRMLKLRFSGLPFCGLRWMLKMKGQSIPTQAMDFSFKFYVSIGSLVHTLVQRSVLRDEEWKYRVYRDYVCPKCRHRVSLSPQVYNTCPSCGFSGMNPDEHEVNWNGALGHIDEIVEMERRKEKPFRMVLDYKTTSVAKVSSKKDLVSPEYRFQIKSYGVALKDEGHPVDATGFVFIPRDNPSKFCIQGAEEFTHKDYSYYSYRLRNALEDHSRCSSYLKSPDNQVAKEIVKSRICKDGLLPEFSQCPFASVCPSNPKQMYQTLKEETPECAKVYNGVSALLKKRPK